MTLKNLVLLLGLALIIPAVFINAEDNAQCLGLFICPDNPECDLEKEAIKCSLTLSSGQQCLITPKVTSIRCTVKDSKGNVVSYQDSHCTICGSGGGGGIGSYGLPGGCQTFGCGNFPGPYNISGDCPAWYSACY